jgi:hypothetical protein
MGAPELHDTLVSIASTCTAARHSQSIHSIARTAERPAAAPVAPAPEHPAGPPTFAQWRHEMCEAASRANCGICWTAPPGPCAASTTLSGHPDGYHAGRFVRAHRRGLIGADELAALTAGLLPAALVWDTPGEVTPC